MTALSASTALPIAVAFTGASGAPYGLRLLQCLLQAGQVVYLLMSKPAQLVIHTETDLHLPARPTDMTPFLIQHYGCRTEQLRVFGQEEWTSPLASGSGRVGAMVVCPCTTGTLAAIAHGSSDTLIERAADVTVKEGRKLILVIRETPLSVIHLDNMLKLARLGVVILPANPGFYHRPQHIADLVDFIVARVLDQLGITHTLMPRWGEK